jgi:hypothetical protein
MVSVESLSRRFVKVVGTLRESGHVGGTRVVPATFHIRNSLGITFLTGRITMRRLFFLSALTAMVMVLFGTTTGALAHDPSDLEIGKEAPDIEGEDIDGVPFRLSDYRGKVVVLDFWGDW